MVQGQRLECPLAANTMCESETCFQVQADPIWAETTDMWVADGIRTTDTPPCYHHYLLSSCFPIPATLGDWVWVIVDSLSATSCIVLEKPWWLFGELHFILLLFGKGSHLSLSLSLSLSLFLYQFLLSFGICGFFKWIVPTPQWNANIHWAQNNCSGADMCFCNDLKALSALGMRSWGPECLPQPVYRIRLKGGLARVG